MKTPTVNCHDFYITALEEVSIAEDRSQHLHTIALAIVDEIKLHKKVALNFICTHNSRRSQLAQVWSYYLASYYSLPIVSYSGGTEVTAFHRNTLQTLRDAGFDFKLKNFSHLNPLYDIRFSSNVKPLVGFSKLYDDPMHTLPFMAITTCTSADENCPFIPNAIARFHLPFIDPKHSDGTDHQEATYNKTNAIIAAEIGYLFKRVKKALED